MINDKNKDCCRLLKCGGCRWLWLVAGVVGVLIVAIAATSDLPWKSVYEVRYEFRVRNFRKNVEGHECALRNMDVMGSYGLCRYMETLPVDEGLTRKLEYDNTERITLCVRGADSAAVADYAAGLYEQAFDTLQRFGDTLFTRVAEVLREEEREVALVAIEIDLASHTKYMDLLNGAELPQAHRTPSRAAVLLWSLVAGLLFAVAVCVLKGRRKSDEGC